MKIQQIKGLFTQNGYNHLNTELNKTLNKLSTGYQVNKTADNAAGFGISEKMRGQIRGLEQAEQNGLAGISLIQTAESGLAQITELKAKGTITVNNILIAPDEFRVYYK